MGIFTRHMPDEGEWGLLKLSPKEAARAMALRAIDDIDAQCCLQSIVFTEWNDPEGLTHGKLPTQKESAEIERQYALFIERLRASLTKGTSLPYKEVCELGSPTLDDFK